MTVSGCVFETGPASAGEGLVVVAEGEFDAEHEDNAEIEAGDKAEVEAVLEPKSVAELGLVGSEYEKCYDLSSEVVVWNSGV